MIEIRKHENMLLLDYTSENPQFDWVGEKLEKHGNVTVGKVFHFEKNDLLPITKISDDIDERFATEEFTTIFILAVGAGLNYRIKANILNTQFDIKLSKLLPISKKTFIAHRGISIFSKIDQLVSEPIIISDDDQKAIPLSEFEELLNKFPTTTELNHYSHSRISLILKNYFETTTDAEQKLNDYLRKKPIRQSTAKIPAIYEYEIAKYEYIRDEIKNNISNANAYSERDWQRLMLKFILLIFPKYVAVLENIGVKDYYSKSTVTNRFIDIALIDPNGNLDVIEIKKPFDDCVISKDKYRDNYTPEKELSGAIMQVEKYIFHLSKLGREGEKKMSETYKKDLPSGITIKITNPKAIIILGRNNGFTADQNFDFEIMKRKYENILDIITYDDLLGRLENIIEKFKSMASV